MIIPRPLTIVCYRIHTQITGERKVGLGPELDLLVVGLCWLAGYR